MLHCLCHQGPSSARRSRSHLPPIRIGQSGILLWKVPGSVWPRWQRNLHFLPRHVLWIAVVLHALQMDSIPPIQERPSHSALSPGCLWLFEVRIWLVEHFLSPYIHFKLFWTIIINDNVFSGTLSHWLITPRLYPQARSIRGAIVERIPEKKTLKTRKRQLS